VSLVAKKTRTPSQRGRKKNSITPFGLNELQAKDR
jgi:hypothetical protein